MTSPINFPTQPPSYPELSDGEKQALKIAEHLDQFTKLIPQIAKHLTNSHFPNYHTTTNDLVTGHLSMVNFHLETALGMLENQQKCYEDLIKFRAEHFKEESDDGNGTTIL